MDDTGRVECEGVRTQMQDAAADCAINLKQAILLKVVLKKKSIEGKTKY